MLTSYPYVPTGYELGIGIAVQSYAGKFFFGFTADAEAAPDVRRMRDFVQEAFQELSRAAGAKKKPPVKKRRTTTGKPVCHERGSRIAPG